MEAGLAKIAEKDPTAKRIKPEDMPEDMMDMRFVAELEKQGFFKPLANKELLGAK